MAYNFDKLVYNRSSALAKNVTLKGSIMETHEPYGEFNTTKNKTTEIKNSIQKSPVFFLVVSICLAVFFANIRQNFLSPVFY
jgi:hypothetical protein